MVEPRRARTSYWSVARATQIEEVIKKSRFLGYVMPVGDEAAAESALEGIREAHASASHVCFGYKAGLEGEVVRFSDAGEPGGTAGRPILEVVEREGLSNTLIAVVRYFGGTLLGAAGLVRAYSGSAAAAIAAAGKSRYDLHEIYVVTVDYALYGRLERLLGEAKISLEDPRFASAVSFDLALPIERVNLVLEKMRDAAGGQIEVRQSGEEFRPAK